MSSIIVPTRLRFIVPGVPVARPRQRHRIVRPKRGKEFVQNYTPADDPVNTYKAAVRFAASAAYNGPPLLGPLRVDQLWIMPRLQSQIWKTKPMPRLPYWKKPDRDNLDKAVLDALNKLLWLDDAQAFDGRITKLYASGDEQPHTVVTVIPWHVEDYDDGEEEIEEEEQQRLEW